MGKYDKLSPPKRGSKITVAKNGQLQVPDDPIVPFIQGEGIHPKIWAPAQQVLEMAVERCYANAKRLEWLEIYAGERANELYGPNQRLPEDTIRAIQEYKVCIKGPLVTPVGSPISLDRILHEQLDLFARVQPMRYIERMGSPLQFPHALNILLFREHTEDLFLEIEWKKGSPEAKQLISMLNTDFAKRLNKTIRPDSGLAIKAISATATKRVIRLALDYATKHRRKSVTFVHQGNFMRHTEGFFRDWGFEIARKEFGDSTVTEQEVMEAHGGEVPRGKILVRERLTGQMMRELTTKPQDFDLVVTTNVNGHLLEELALASTGGHGLAPKAYVGAKAAVFEATHHLLPRYEGRHHSPISTLLAGVLLFDHLGWKDAGELVTNSVIKTVSDGHITPDLDIVGEEADTCGTDEFCHYVIENFEEVRKSRVRQAMKRAATAIP